MVDAVHLHAEAITQGALVVVAALDVAEALAEVDHQEIIVKVQENHFLLDVMYQALDTLIKMMDGLIIHLEVVLVDLMEVLYHVNDPLVKPVHPVLLPKNVRELKINASVSKKKRRKCAAEAGHLETVEEMHSLEFISFLIVLMFYENNVRVRNEEYVDVFGNSG